MRAKELLGKVKKINHDYFRIAVFLAFIFILGAAAMPETIATVQDLFNYEDFDTITAIGHLASTIDERYYEALGVDHPFLLNKRTYIDMNGLMARVMGQRYMNEVGRLYNGHLAFCWADPAYDISQSIKMLTRLNEEQIAREKAFLFVLAPGQLPINEDVLPIGIEADMNEHSDKLVAALRNNSVPVIDLREEMVKEGISFSDAFFKTDHHWTPETGFWAYAKIVDYMIQIGVIDPIDSMYTDISQYNVDVHKNWFLGSAGKRTGRYFAGVDDFSIITPKFDTYLSVRIPSIGLDVQGDFLTIGFDHDANRYDLYGTSPYNSYGHTCRIVKYYNNEYAPTDLNLMCIGDSFADVPFTFLSLIAKASTELDMRFNESDFLYYYNKTNPDILVVLVSADDPSTENTTFNFFED